MKRLQTAIAAGVFFIYSYSSVCFVCFASYVAHLKDGREFVTEKYSEKGDKINLKEY